MPYADPANQRLPFASSSDTSHDAAVAARTTAPDQRARYFSWLASCGVAGGTDAEAETALTMRRSSICARRNELMTDGKVVKTDARRSGCAVWRAA